jgi:diketogulonate reductase-like aldo/keto reductase
MARGVSRRTLLRMTTVAAVSACAPTPDRAAAAGSPGRSAPAAPAPPAPRPPASPSPVLMNTRAMPRTREAIPTIGLGTWQAFDVDAAGRAPLVAVVREFLAAGGRVIDSSPMYGRSEAVVGDVLAELGAIGAPFLATKVWTRGRREAVAQMAESRRRMRAERIDLMQIHNLLDWQTHLPVLREHKRAGSIRYLGVTHYAHSSFAELERLIRGEQLDFVQLPYNLADRAAEARLLPAAADTGTAVLVMRPFEEGALFRRVRGKPLPGCAAELGCTSWAQIFLKFILGHPAVTCPIPATSDPTHLADNLRAGFGPLPDPAQRRAMIAALDG